MNLLIRADASVAIGTGHVMRCLALAQAWQDAGGKATFAMAERTLAIEARLGAESCEVLRLECEPATANDAGRVAALAGQQKAAWIVVDGYGFSAEYQHALKEAGFKVLFVDDYGQAQRYCADFVLNQNVYATEAMYEHSKPGTKLLLGSRYCMLRREFARWREWKREIVPVGRKILVTMGGSDPQHLTGLVMEALHGLPATEVTIVVGGSAAGIGALPPASQSNYGIRIEKNVLDMAELMAWADVAVTGAGTTCWEMCLLKLPMAVIGVAENQRPIAEALERMGTAIHLGDAKSITRQEIATRVGRLLGSQKERAELSKRCGTMVDGRGAERVVAELVRG